MRSLLFVPRTNRERVFCGVIVVLVLSLLVLMGSQRARSNAELELEVCRLDLGSAEKMREHYKGERDVERESYREDLKAREVVWAGVYERTKDWAAAGIECKGDDCANEYCWERIEGLESQLEGEKKMYLWNLKFSGAIQEKDARSVRKYEAKVKAYAKDPANAVHVQKVTSEVGLSTEELEKLLED